MKPNAILPLAATQSPRFTTVRYNSCSLDASLRSLRGSTSISAAAGRCGDLSPGMGRPPQALDLRAENTRRARLWRGKPSLVLERRPSTAEAQFGIWLADRGRTELPRCCRLRSARRSTASGQPLAWGITSDGGPEAERSRRWSSSISIACRRPPSATRVSWARRPGPSIPRPGWRRLTDAGHGPRFATARPVVIQYDVNGKWGSRWLPHGQRDKSERSGSECECGTTTGS